MTFGQIVIGPPGSGKTTYCNGLAHFFELTGRKTAVVNLDPANDILPYPIHYELMERNMSLQRPLNSHTYECAVNIEELIKLEDVMAEHGLGPNGGLVYCMDYLEKNMDWLMDKLKPFENHYLLFDFPGQVELFTLHENAKNVITEMTRKWDYRLTAVHLVDSHLCSDPEKYVGGLLLSLSTMLHMELPHINVLSKIDLIESYGKLAFNLDFYTDVQDLSYLQYSLNSGSRTAKYRKLTKSLCEVIEDFGLVNFTTLNIQDQESVTDLVRLVDKSNGYVFAGMEGNIDAYNRVAVGPQNWDYYRTAAIQEKYMKGEDDSEERDTT